MNARVIKCTPATEPTVRLDDESGRFVKDGGNIPVYWPAVTDVPCPDCDGTIRWAEAGYVPGWRQCDGCSTHWLAGGTPEKPTLVEQAYSKNCGPYAKVMT